MVLTTSDKERHAFLPSDISLTLTPSQERREEQCGNCGTVMAPNHQCEISHEKIVTYEEEKGPVVFKMLESGYAETKLLAFGEIPIPRVLHPTLGIGTKTRKTEFQDNHWIFEQANVQMEMYKFQ